MKRMLILAVLIAATLGLYSTADAGCLWGIEYWFFPTTDGDAGTSWSNCPDQGTNGANVEFYRVNCSNDENNWFSCNQATTTRIYPYSVSTIGNWKYYTFAGNGFSNGTFNYYDLFSMNKRVNGSVVETVQQACRKLHNDYDGDYVHCTGHYSRP